jgi:hypothetical protein
MFPLELGGCTAPAFFRQPVGGIMTTYNFRFLAQKELSRVAELQDRAVRTRRLAARFSHDPAAPRMVALAEELEAEIVRLQQKDPCPLYFFTSRSVSSVRAFTSDVTGANLPADYAPWEKSRSKAPLPGDGSPIAALVQRDGFFLVTGRDQVGERKMRGTAERGVDDRHQPGTQEAT